MIDSRMTNPADTAREMLHQASVVAALTGAGISAESGIPTFRGDQGLWRNFRAEDLATPQAFARDPGMVWEWYDWRRSQIAEARPNAGHKALAELERRARFTLITQNVDGLHDLAGSAHPLKLHGDIWTLRCTDCGAERTDRSVPLAELPPRCSCGGMERPGVVWFGEALPARTWEEAEQASRSADLFLVVGTSALVYPAAGLAHIAREAGAKVIEINPAETPLSGLVDLAWRAPATEALPGLLHQ